MVAIYGAHLGSWSSKGFELVGREAVIYACYGGHSMNILVCGDICAKPGRSAVQKYANALIEKYGIDLFVANVDNAAHGLGVTPSIFNEIIGYGADVCTGGNHIFDKPEILSVAQNDRRLLRPYNYSEYTPGHGIIKLHKNGKEFLVVHIAGQKNMKENADNPFIAMDHILNDYQLGKNIDAIIVDFHADVTSEKVAMGHYLDGRVSFVFGTHTHVPSADLRILKNGTAYISDLGMTGDYDTVISMDKKNAIGSFIKQGNFGRFEPTLGDGTFFGALVKLNECGLAKSVQQVRVGQDDLWKYG